VFGIASAVKDGHHRNNIRFHDEEHLIRESPRQDPADTPIDDGVLKRIAQDGVHRHIDGYEQIRTKAGNATFVSLEGFRELGLGFGSNRQVVGHFRLAIRSRTTGQGVPAVGSLR
jgi:hypothetical protein